MGNLGLTLYGKQMVKLPDQKGGKCYFRAGPNLEAALCEPGQDRPRRYSTT